LRFVVSSLAIDYFDFHALIFNHATGKQKKFFISRGNSIFVMKPAFLPKFACSGLERVDVKDQLPQ
jgi:hypothetical protein